jgi:hypothetical protein
MPTISSNTTSVTVGPSGCTTNCNPCTVNCGSPCTTSCYPCGSYYCYPTSGCAYSCYPCGSYTYTCYPVPTYFQSPVPAVNVLCGVISGYRDPSGGAGYITVDGETIILQPGVAPSGAFTIGTAYCVTFTLASNGQVLSLTIPPTCRLTITFAVPSRHTVRVTGHILCRTAPTARIRDTAPRRGTPLRPVMARMPIRR